MQSEIFMRTKDKEKLKDIFGLGKWRNLTPEEAVSEGITAIKAPGTAISVVKISEAAHRGFIFSGIARSYGDERIFASDGQEYSVVRAHNSQPIATVGRDGSVNEEERDEIIRFFKILGRTHEKLNV